MATDNALELQDLYKETLVRETIEKTKSGDITWTQITGTNFRTTFGAWQHDVSKTQISSLSFRYNLDVRKNGNMFVALEDGPLLRSDRDSQVKELYEIVEIDVLQLDSKIIEANQAIQNV